MSPRADVEKASAIIHKNLVSVLMIGHGPGQLVKMKSAIQILPDNCWEPNGCASWFVSSKLGTFPSEGRGRLEREFT